VTPGSGEASGGSTVTVTGSGFIAPVQVTFGGVPAPSVQLESPTAIQAVTPAGAGGQYVQVEDWMGTSTSSVSFTYPVSQPPGTLVALPPSRICDTRPGNPSGLTGAAAQCDGRSLGANVPLQVQVTGLDGIPTSGVTGVALNVTVTQPTTPGFLTVFPAGGPVPLASNLNFTPGETVANAVQLGVGVGGAIEVVTSAASADVVIDVDGYFAATGSQAGGLYQALAPSRICDTRVDQPQNQCTGETLGSQRVLAVDVSGQGGVPSGATAAVLNVTATDTTAASYLTVFPSAVPPTASNVNWLAGQTVANLVLATLNSAGQVLVYNAAGTADVAIDVLGYYTPSGTSGAAFTPAPSPIRICDTRVGQPENQCTGQTLGPGQTMTVQVAGRDGIPAGTIAAVLNVTATDTTAASYMTVFPSGSPPLASSVNWQAGETVPNLVIATLNPAGTVSIYNSSGSLDVVVDVLGWYDSNG